MGSILFETIIHNEAVRMCKKLDGYENMSTEEKRRAIEMTKEELRDKYCEE